MSNESFFLDMGRAMISLGPLSETRHCPYKCAFCYVQDGFEKYDKLDDEQILKFLKVNKEKYNIIYVSGDTDSFAPPRTMRAIGLLDKISKELSCDLLFTTRTTFSSEEIMLIKKVVKTQAEKGKNLFASISITRYSDESSYIEPSPIPSPDERIETIKNLKRIGATTVLAMRPFLPVVNIQDYLTILEKSKGFVDIALGEPFYFADDGKVSRRVFGDVDYHAFENEIVENVQMAFDKNSSIWKLWTGENYEKVVSQRCKELGIIFSMHSSDAINEFKEKQKSLNSSQPQ